MMDRHRFPAILNVATRVRPQVILSIPVNGHLRILECLGKAHTMQGHLFHVIDRGRQFRTHNI